MKWEAKLVKHRGEDRIALFFEKNAEYIARVKKLQGVRWSANLKAWHVPDNSSYRKRFGLEQISTDKALLARIHPINQVQLEAFIQEMKLRGFSPSTINTYRNEFGQFLYHSKSFDVQKFSALKIRSYLLYCLEHLKLSENSVHSRINAIKFFYEKVLRKQNFSVNIPRPKKPSQLPKVISTRDIKKILESSTNLKHNTMLKLCYGMGLRVSEIVNLKLKDIDSERMRVHIVSSKGKKDRYVTLPNSVLEQLRQYYTQYKPKKYLFEGQFGDMYSIRSVQLVFKNALTNAKVNKQVGIHILRHSYATHLHEAGTDIAFIQKLLGHSNIKTTLIYTQVSNASLGNIQSPLDKL